MIILDYLGSKSNHNSSKKKAGCLKQKTRRHTHREEGRVKIVVESGVMMQQIKECQEQPEAGRGKKDPPPESLERTWPFQYLDFRLLAFKTMKESILFILSPLVYGNLSHHPSKLTHRVIRRDNLYKMLKSAYLI